MYFAENDIIIEYEEVLIFDHDTIPVSPTNSRFNDSITAVDYASNYTSFSNEHVCIFCNQDFLDEVDLRCHINRVLECEYCKRWFCDRDIFMQHSQSHVKTEFNPICRKSNNDEKNLPNEVELEFKGVVYDETFFTEKSILIQILPSHCEEEKQSDQIFALKKSVYECDYCKKLYRCKKRLTIHILAHIHGKGFQCYYCGKEYMYKSSLNDHVRLHTGEGLFECKECGKLCESRRKLARHSKLHTLQRDFACHVCGKKFLIKAALTQHLRIHDPKRIRNEHCDVCSNDYTREYFPIHRQMHTGEKPNQCKLCDKSFAQPSGLWEHRAVHDVERKYECPCGKRFARKKDLKRHVVQHTGKGFVHCAHCNKAFSSNWLLQNHERKHTGERPFICKICGDSFTQKANLATHLRTHTGEQPFACEYCGRRFSLKGKLKQHLLIHTGDKPFACEFCDSHFRQLSTLRSHVLTHTQDTPFKCDCCGQEFRRKLLLIRHISQKHVLECYY